jgi:hypothetical protein
MSAIGIYHQPRGSRVESARMEKRNVCNSVLSQLRWTLATVLAVGLIGLSAMAQEGMLTGTVFDPQGAAVAHNVVDLRWNDVGTNANTPKRKARTHITTTTDSAGHFQLRLDEGDYDVFAYRDGFAPVCTVVSIEPNSTKNVELRFPALAPQPMTNRAK